MKRDDRVLCEEPWLVDDGRNKQIKEMGSKRRLKRNGLGLGRHKSETQMQNLQIIKSFIFYFEETKKKGIFLLCFWDSKLYASLIWWRCSWSASNGPGQLRQPSDFFFNRLGLNFRPVGFCFCFDLVSASKVKLKNKYDEYQRIKKKKEF